MSWLKAKRWKKFYENNYKHFLLAELKTQQNNADVHDFINSFADTDQKRSDSFEILKLMQDFTG